MANPRTATGNTRTTVSRAKAQPGQNPPAQQTSPQPADKAADPLDFETLPLDVLRKFRNVNKLNVQSPRTLAGFLLDSPVGRRTMSYKSSNRVSKPEAASQLKRHFMNQGVRESEFIVDFIYSVRRQDRAFKLQFS